MLALKSLEESKQDKNEYSVWWRRPEQFADEIVSAYTSHQGNVILTAYELFYEKGALFQGMPEQMYNSVLQVLVDRREAVLVKPSIDCKKEEIGIKLLF
jgi:hypothetical protein